eukprot:COSAG06_NODE_31850_length_514_cov_24.026506_1_plen_25_part_10
MVGIGGMQMMDVIAARRSAPRFDDL